MKVTETPAGELSTRNNVEEKPNLLNSSIEIGYPNDTLKLDINEEACISSTPWPLKLVIDEELIAAWEKQQKLQKPGKALSMARHTL